MEEEHVLGWDDEISKESQFLLLPEGDYPFTITHYEKGYHNGSEKIPACPMAIVFFSVSGKDGTAELRQQFYLHTKMEWKLSELFMSVGLKKKGEPLRMQWDKLPGLSGKCKVTQKPGTQDPSKIFNQIDKLYPGDGKKKFTPGSFG